MILGRLGVGLFRILPEEIQLPVLIIAIFVLLFLNALTVIPKETPKPTSAPNIPLTPERQFILGLFAFLFIFVFCIVCFRPAAKHQRTEMSIIIPHPGFERYRTYDTIDSRVQNV